MSRHVVLLTRDTSLAVALKALFGDRDRVTEIESPNGWRALNGSPVDAVVVDLPPATRKAAVEALERKFTGPLVVLLDPGEELAMSMDQRRCSALHRPFGMSELWTLLVSAPPEAAQDIPPQPSSTPARSVTSTAPAVERPSSYPPEPATPWSGGGSPESGVPWPGGGSPESGVPWPGGGSPESAASWTDGRASEMSEPAWRWRLRRFQQVPTPSEPGELTEPMPRVEPGGDGAAAAAAEAAAEAEARVGEAEMDADAGAVDAEAAAAEAEARVGEAEARVGEAEMDADAGAVDAEAAAAVGAEVESVAPVAAAEAPAVEAEAPAADVADRGVEVAAVEAPGGEPADADTAGGEVESVAPAAAADAPANDAEAPAAEVAGGGVAGGGVAGGGVEVAVAAADAETGAVDAAGGQAPVAEVAGGEAHVAAPAAEAETLAAEAEAEGVDAEVAAVEVPVGEPDAAAAPPAALASDTGAGDTGAAERATPLMDTTMWHEADEAPQAVANRLAKRLRLDVIALLLDNGRGLLDTAGGVGLAPAERRLQVEYGHDVLRELFRVGVGLIDDTARVRGILGGIPFGEADTLMMVPLAYEGHGFGVLLAGRYRRKSSVGESEFTEHEIEALMDFAEDVAPALRSAILLRRLKGKLNLAQGI